MARKLLRRTNSPAMRFSRLAWSSGTSSRTTFCRNPTRICLRTQMGTATGIWWTAMDILLMVPKLSFKAVSCTARFIRTSWISCGNRSWITWPSQRRFWLKSMKMAMLFKSKLTTSRHCTSMSKWEKLWYSWRTSTQVRWTSAFRAGWTR